MVFEFANLSLSKEKLNMIGPNDSKEILSASIYWLRVLTVDSDQDRLGLCNKIMPTRTFSSCWEGFEALRHHIIPLPQL